MTRVLYALGRWCATHGALILVLWLALLGGVRVADQLLPPPALDPFVLAGTDSAAAQTLLNRAFPGSASEPVPLVMTDAVDLLGEPGARTVDAVRDAVAQVPGVNGVRGPRDDPDLASADGRTVILQLTMAERAAADKAVGEEVLSTAIEAAATSPTARVALGGYLGQQISRTDTRPSEALGLALAVLVLLVTLRRGWPVAIPLATALVAVGIGLAVISLLGRMVHIPDEAPTLGTMLGLGVGIDYALFLVTRHRNLLRRGFPVADSVGRTAGTAGAGMVFAGATLLAAVTGLALTGISFLAWLGYSAAIVVALALLAALTLVPALMGLMGTRVLRRSDQRALESRTAARHAAGPEVGPAAGADPDPGTGPGIASDDTDEQLDRGTWARIANAVTERPWRWAIGATGLLLLMAAPMLTMTFQQVDATALPDDTTAHQAYDMINEGFGPGFTGPLAVVGQLHRAAEIPDPDADPGSDTDPGSDADPAPAGPEPADPRSRDPRVVALSQALTGTAGIAEVGAAVVSTDGGVVIWRAVPETGASDKATEALVHELRTEVLPEATEGADMTAYVGGVTAARTDLSLRIAERLLPFILGVATFSFLLLMVAYRSLVIPLKAAAMNLLSISAAYGVVVAIFQWGWGAELIGLDGPVPIESYVPMMMFAVLFGLSMDYEVFLLTAFTEHYQRTGDITTAVRRGLADTGQLITAAALIMVVVFASFIMPDNAVVKMFGVGLATAVLVDATIVRCVLVPSLMVLAARWTWWLPGWLDRALPHLHVEGDPAQLESVGAPRRPQRADARPGAGPVAAVLGAGAGWVAGALAVTSATPTVGAAIALAAASGAALAYLPRATRGADGLLWVRLVMMLAGALGAGALYLLVGGLTPATDHNPLLQSGVALLVPLAVATLTPLRRFAIPICMGTLATVAAMAAGGGLALDVVAVPTLVAALTSRVATLVGRALLPRPAPGPDDPAVNEPAVNAPAFNDPVVDSPAFTDPVVDSPDPTGPVHPDPGPAREAAGATIGPVRP